MKRILRWLLAVSLAALLALAGAYAWFLSWLDAPGPSGQETVVLIPRGTGIAGIAQRLVQQQVVSHVKLLELAAWYTDTAGRLKAGEYLFPAAETPRRALERIAAGRVMVRRLTIPEGLSSAAIRQLVEAAEAMSGEWPKEPVPEGALLPETYHYVYGDNRADLVARMRKSHENLLAELWAKRASDLPLTTPEQAVILASIVEAETPIPAERARVAGVYINRLRKGMRLQADPTVVYGLTKGERELDRPLSRADLAKATPWNTYTVDGLPPTPINHPGRASLAAVLQPEQHDFIFFVADGKGGHLFATTYEQHLKNVAAYRASQRR